MIFRSEDRVIEFTVTDDTTALPFDLADAIGIVIMLYQFADKPLEQYSLIASAGYQDITITDAPNGVMEINYESAKSKMAIDKPLYADIKIRIQNANFSAGVQDLIAGKIEISLMADSPLKYTDVPV